MNEIESDTITSILANEEWRGVLLRGLEDDDFQNPLCKAIFNSCKATWQRGETIDAAAIFLTLDEKIKDKVDDAQKAFIKIVDGPTVSDPAYAINELKAERRRQLFCEIGNAISKTAECGELAKMEDLARQILSLDCTLEHKKMIHHFPGKPCWERLGIIQTSTPS